ncbi:acyl-CoA synthetase [Pseudonocardia sp. RS010]|uniref:acyl-CoA synthetase n=1 Tax=Pseudonocardia sp. RS010 TaxID=3385979 RepID=UPI0039A14C32
MKPDAPAMYPGAFARTHPDKPAYIMASTGDTTTFAELDTAANRLSQVLRDAGIQPGDHVAFCLENHPLYLQIAWGCIYAGAVFTPCSSRLTSGELAYMVEDCGATVFITSERLADRAREVVDLTPGVRLRLMVDGTIEGYASYEKLTAAASSDPLTERVAGIDMFYSSGTTGQPKGVNRRFVPEPLERGTKSARSTTRLVTRLQGASTESVYLSPAPLYHSAPLRFCLAMTGIGATVVVMDRFDAEEYLSLVERFRVTHSQVVPTMFVRMLKLDPEIRRRYDLSSLQCVAHASAPCPVPVKEQIIEWFGPVIHEYYSGTEGNGFAYVTTEEWLAHRGSVGRPLGCRAHVVDDDGVELGPREVGTIYFEGGAGFEYHNDSEKTRQGRHPHGWTTLGDIGYLDEDGYLYLTDRQAFVIISGGVNIYPQEAENVLITHPQVVDVAVFGVPNADFGEEVKAVVQPVTMPASQSDAESLVGELIAYCRSALADLKCPRSIDFRAELPRQATGKLYKRLLRDEYWTTPEGA